MDMFGVLTLLGTFFAGVTVGAWLNGLTTGLERSPLSIPQREKEQGSFPRSGPRIACAPDNSAFGRSLAIGWPLERVGLDGKQWFETNACSLDGRWTCDCRLSREGARMVFRQWGPGIA
jgi:hypothetical protein